MPAGGRVLALSESSVRLGIRGERQPETGIGLPGTHISVAQSWGRAAIRRSAAAIGEMREVAERTFTDLRVFRLTEPACLQYKQIVVLATRRKRLARLSDAALLDGARYLEALATKAELEPLLDAAEVRYEVPASGPVILNNLGIPLDEVEDLLLESAAYLQAGRVLLPKLNDVRGRPLTPLHGGHVGLLCTAGMLNGVFGEGDNRHIAHWRSVKFTDHWEEVEEDGTKSCMTGKGSRTS